MKKIIVSSILSIVFLLTAQYLYVVFTPKSQLVNIVSTLKGSQSPEEHSDENTRKETPKNNRITVSDVKTGYYAANLWYPSVIVKFKNTSGNDLKEYINAKAVFIDNKTNEQIGIHTKYLSTSHEMFLDNTSMRKQFKSDVGFRGSYQGLDISLKLYLEDSLIGTYKVNNIQL